MLKRNDLCSCGSGKKYKKCCYDNDKKQRISRIQGDKLISKKESVYAKYTKAITKLSKHLEDLINNDPKYDKLEEDCRKSLFEGIEIKNEIASSRFVASFISYDYFLDSENTLATYALSKFKFSNAEKDIVISCVRSFPSLFEIVKINGQEIIIKDLFTSREFYTLDYKILNGFKVGDYLLARPVKIDDIFVLVDITIRIQKKTKDLIFNDFMKLYLENEDKVPSIEFFVAVNSAYFYKYMIQLLQISDYNEGSTQIKKPNHKVKTKKVNKKELAKEEAVKEEAVKEDNILSSILEKNIEEESIKKAVLDIYDEIKDKVNVSKTENGWASALEYYYRKSIGENVTQGSIASKYEVSASTLAKRNKEISAILSK